MTAWLQTLSILALAICYAIVLVRIRMIERILDGLVDCGKRLDALEKNTTARGGWITGKNPIDEFDKERSERVSTILKSQT